MFSKLIIKIIYALVIISAIILIGHFLGAVFYTAIFNAILIFLFSYIYIDAKHIHNTKRIVMIIAIVSIIMLIISLLISTRDELIYQILAFLMAFIISASLMSWYQNKKNKKKDT